MHDSAHTLVSPCSRDVYAAVELHIRVSLDVFYQTFKHHHLGKMTGRVRVDIQNECTAVFVCAVKLPLPSLVDFLWKALPLALRFWASWSDSSMI